MTKSSDLRSKLRARRESRELDYKEDIDPALTQHIVGLAKDLAAFANTLGGTIIIGVEDRTFRPIGLSMARLALLTPEDLDNKLNELVEPRVEFDVIPFDARSKHFVAVCINKAETGPCVMKKPGNHPGPIPGKTVNAFGRGAVFVRHGAKSVPATQRDFERIFRERLDAERHSWLGNVRKISEAPPGSEIVVTARSGAVRVTTDPSAPAVRNVLDTTKIGSVNEELTAGVKIWNTDQSALMSEHQLCRFYAARKELQLDNERAEFLVRSSLSRRMPFFYWASSLDWRSLRRVLVSELENQSFPGDCESLKLAFLIGGTFGDSLLESTLSATCHPTCVSAAERLRSMSGRNAVERQRHLLVQTYGSTVSYATNDGKRTTTVHEILNGGTEIEALATTLARDLVDNHRHENKAALKRLDVGLYGRDLKGAQD